MGSGLYIVQFVTRMPLGNMSAEVEVAMGHVGGGQDTYNMSQSLSMQCITLDCHAYDP